MVHRKSSARVLACLCFLSLAPFAAPAQENSSDFPKMKPEALKKMIEKKSADILVVSNDPQESFDEAHIPGAVSLPWADQLPMPVKLPRNKTLILYCSRAHEEDSSDMAAKLSQFGYRNVKVLAGGISNWMQLKYPLEKK